MEFPDSAGVMILNNCDLFPLSRLPLFIFEPRYRTMLADALESHRMFCLALRRPDSAREQPCEVAGLGLVRVSVQNTNGTSNLVLQGLTRVRLGKAVQTRPYRVHLIEPLIPEPTDSLVADALVARTLELVEARLKFGNPLPLAVVTQLSSDDTVGPPQIENLIRALDRIGDPGTLADLVARLFLPDPMMRQLILQTVNIEERLRHLVHFLVEEVARTSNDND
ncbi:MAG TPA: hypothetical protein DCE44_11525 [Verrucomicrobiales bacterium]|nr:hypothetical protein [Verrucomicrobiales bacterium]